MDYKICKLIDLDDNQLNEATSICVDGLYNVFSLISKDKSLLIELFKDSFHYDMCYACLYESDVVGFMGLSNSVKRAAGAMKRETFERIFGERYAKFAYPGISAGFIKPKVKSSREVEIDFLATDLQHRSKGIGKLLVNYIIENMDYDSCVLDVYSKNIKAIKFYERLGFKQIKVRSEWVLRLHGIGKTITMKLDKGEILL